MTPEERAAAVLVALQRAYEGEEWAFAENLKPPHSAAAIEAVAAAIREAEAAAESRGRLAEKTRLHSLLVEVGKLTKWGGRAQQGLGGGQQAGGELRRIKVLVERETGKEFEEYT